MKIIITSGDPNGIGIEVLLKAFSHIDIDNYPENLDFFVAGNKSTIMDYAAKIKCNFIIEDNFITIENRKIEIIDCCDEVTIELGKPTYESGKYAARAIEFAVDETISGKFDAVVTMPVSKEALYLAGWKYPGHTEMLGAKCGLQNQQMILLTGSVRVALATVHIPLHEVSSKINSSDIADSLKTFINCLKRDFGISEPKIAVLGLNPHAGESGAIGNEEIDEIIPAINTVRRNDIIIAGPFPADGFFAHREYLNYDGILAMYHDQGLIPLKMIAGEGGVNITAGLPIVRTSPAHGTAYNIAGKNIASPQSAVESIKLAIEIVKNRQK